MKTPEELATETAEKIVALTGYGHALHVNDVLPDILEAARKIAAIEAARLVRESGAVEALEACLDWGDFFANPNAPDIARAALAKLRAISGGQQP